MDVGTGTREDVDVGGAVDAVVGGEVLEGADVDSVAVTVTKEVVRDVDETIILEAGRTSSPGPYCP